MSNSPILAPALSALLGSVLLAGCGGDDVRIYQIPRQPEAQQSTAATVADHGSATATPILGWKLPDGWEEVPATEMRAASFRVKDNAGNVADVSIIPLPGLAGKDLENVNRWRGQVGQPPLTEEDLAKTAEPVVMGGQSASLYDQAGENTASGEKLRILAAILRRDGVAWFFKMMGDEALIASQKPAFVSFLKSITFESGAGGSATASLPASHPPIGGMPAAAPGSTTDEGKPRWEVPPGWQEVSGGQFLVAKFQIAGPDSAQAAVNVSSSAGEGGGLAGNVNRWRKQLGLDELTADDLQKQVTALDAGGIRVSLVDFSGTDPRTNQKVRLVGAIAPLQGQTWFFKLMGDTALVDREKAAFIKFVQTVKYASS